MKYKYTELLTIESIVAAMNAGKHVECTKKKTETRWMRSAGKEIHDHLKYRLVEEVEETPDPQQEDMISVSNNGTIFSKRKFVLFYGGRCWCEDGGDPINLYPWYYWKPIEPERVAREGWTPKKSMFASPNEALKIYGWKMKDLVRVREVI